jgi:hypothetical protein
VQLLPAGENDIEMGADAATAFGPLSKPAFGISLPAIKASPTSTCACTVA